MARRLIIYYNVCMSSSLSITQSWLRWALLGLCLSHSRSLDRHKWLVYTHTHRYSHIWRTMKTLAMATKVQLQLVDLTLETRRSGDYCRWAHLKLIMDFKCLWHKVCYALHSWNEVNNGWSVGNCAFKVYCSLKLCICWERKYNKGIERVRSSISLIFMLKAH